MNLFENLLIHSFLISDTIQRLAPRYLSII